MLKSVRTATTSEWRKAYEQCADASFFHGPLWSETWAEYSGGRFRPAPMHVAFEGGATAVLGVTIEKTRLRQERWHLSPAGTYGGWISAEPLSAREAPVLTKFLLGQPAIVWRSAPSGAGGQPPTERATPAECTHVIDLRQGVPAARAAWKGSARRSASAARRRGVVVRQGNRTRDWTCYRDLYLATVARWQRPSTIYQPAMFDVLAGHRSEEIMLALAIQDGRAVAGGIVFLHGARAAYWSGASAAEVHGATNLLLWEVMAELALQGVEMFDLNPSGGHSGVVAFKESLGAKASPTSLVVRERPTVRALSRVRRFTRRMLAGGRMACGGGGEP